MLESIHVLIKFAQNFFDQFFCDYVSTIQIYQGILYFLYIDLGSIYMLNLFKDVRTLSFEMEDKSIGPKTS
jgi:hypothetical protein